MKGVAMTRKRTLRPLAMASVVLLASATITACSGGGSRDSSTATGGQSGAEGAPRSGGTLRVAVAADAKTIHPYKWGSRVEMIRIQQLYDTLVGYDKEARALGPRLAEKWATSKDGKTITFTLRKGVKFSNGKALTAKDVVYSLTTAANPSSTRTSAALKHFTSAEASGDDTVVVTLGAPDRAFIGSLIEVYVIPEGSGDELAQTPVGTGPFHLKSWARNQSMVLEKNADYWEKDRPYLGSVEFKVVPDASAQALQLQNGEADMLAPQAPFTMVRQAEGLGLSVALPAKDTSVGFFDIRINTRKAPWDRAEVRQALSYAVDREQVKQSLLGMAVPTSNPFQATDPDFNADVTDYTKGGADKARSVLAAANLSTPITAEVIVSCDVGEEYKVAAQSVVESVKKAGIDIRMTCVDVATLVARQNQGDYVLSMSGFVPASTLLGTATKMWLGTDNTGWDEATPAFTSALSNARAAVDDTEYKKAINEVQRLIADGQSRVIVSGQVRGPAMRPNVAGYVQDPLLGFDVTDAWIKSK